MTKSRIEITMDTSGEAFMEPNSDNPNDHIYSRGSEAARILHSTACMIANGYMAGNIVDRHEKVIGRWQIVEG